MKKSSNANTFHLKEIKCKCKYFSKVFNIDSSLDEEDSVPQELFDKTCDLLSQDTNEPSNQLKPPTAESSIVPSLTDKPLCTELPLTTISSSVDVHKYVKQCCLIKNVPECDVDMFGKLFQITQTLEKNQSTMINDHSKLHEELTTLSDLTVPALRNIEAIITDIQTQQRNLSNNVQEIQQWLKLQLSSLMNIVKEVKSDKIHNNSIPPMYEQLNQKHEQIEAIQNQCIEKMDKYFHEICRLNAAIQEKDNEILKLKLQCSNKDSAKMSIHKVTRPMVDFSAQTVPDLSTENANTNQENKKAAISDKAETKGITGNKGNIKYTAQSSFANSGDLKEDEANLPLSPVTPVKKIQHYKETVPLKKFTAFRGSKNPLSIFFPFKFRPQTELLDEVITFSSLEHAYAYGKARFHKDSKRAELIKNAATARDTQLVGNEINTTKSWQKVKQGFIESVLNKKLETMQ